MVQAIQQYFKQATATPWGKLFYECLFQQLPVVTHSSILDFGSGFGISAKHYGPGNQLTAIEPNQKMIELALLGEYQQLIGDVDQLANLPKASFDLILCHNVLEYTVKQREIVSQLLTLLKKGGRLSIVKHHLPGALIQEAVLNDNPRGARAVLEGEEPFKKVSYFGEVKYYDDEQLARWCQENGAVLKMCFGIRSLYGLSQNNEIKYTDEWYQQMLALESAMSSRSPYYEMAFYHHLIIEKE